MAIEVRKVILENVSDASGLAALIDEGAFTADEVIAVIGKTEGNGGVNDFTRILADQAFRKVLMDPWCGPAGSTESCAPMPPCSLVSMEHPAPTPGSRSASP